MERRNNLQVDDRLHLIDVSSEDDSLIYDLSGFSGSHNEPEYFKLSEVLNSQEKEFPATSPRETKQELMLSESLEPERTRKPSKCNLRKSLTWDNAFFTNDGVLDPEELSIINCGLKKAHPLTSIQEDMRRSGESNSTLDSDNLSLESLEVDLFADIRASIQRSSKETNSSCSSVKTRPGESASRKMDLASRNKMKPMAIPKRQSISTQGPEKTKKEAGTEKTKKEAIVRPQAVQATAKSGDLNTSSLRPPKMFGRINLVSAESTKRTSLGPNRVKSESLTAKVATGKVGPNLVSKKAALGDSSSILRFTTSSPRSSSSSSLSVTKSESVASCSSHNRSGSTSSESSGKSPLKSVRCKINSRRVNQAMGSTVKTFPMALLENKTESADSRLATYLKSVSNTTSSISPASSIDGWSSESSSSTSTVNQQSNGSKTSLDSPRNGFYLERDAAKKSDVQKYQHDRPCVGYERTRSPSQFAKITPEARAVSHTPSTDASKSFKPSGLRMPSPKIGFFDAEKSTVQTPNSNLQSHPGVRSGIPKHVSGSGSLHVGALKTKPGKHQPARTVTGASSKNCDPHSAGVPYFVSSMKPTSLAQLQELSNASPRLCSTPTTRGKSPGITSKHQNDESLRIGKGSLLKSGGRELSKTDRQDIYKNNLVPKSQGLVHTEYLQCTPTEEDVLQNFQEASTECDFDLTQLEKMENSIIVESCFEMDLTSLPKSNEREALRSVEKEVDCLGRHISSVDLLKSTATMEDVLEGTHKESSASDYYDINALKSGERLLNEENYRDSNLSPVHKSNEKENTQCIENQVDYLSWHVGSIGLYNEGFPRKTSSPPPLFDVNYLDNLVDPQFALLDLRKAPMHGQEHFPKDLSKCSPLSLSLNSMDIIPVARTPLVAKLSSCDVTGSLESALEPMLERSSTLAFAEGTG